MGIETRLPETGIITTSIETVVNWSRKYSMWPAGFGLACCALEMMATAMAHNDLSRFGMEIFRSSPRQADLMIIAGTLTKKMSPVARKVYDQMPEPKWVLAMGSCACTGGVFDSYAVVQGADMVIPVDVYVPGCPPRPEALLHGILTIWKKVEKEKIHRKV
jgi:NADH-quinone oxidoreductase subunit B